MPAALPHAVTAALARGEKLEAIRILRELSDLSLMAAKEAVESGQMPDEIPSSSVLVPDAITGSQRPVRPLPPSAVAALQAGHWGQAVVQTRQATGLGLAEAVSLLKQALSEDPLLAARVREVADMRARDLRRRLAYVVGAIVLLLVAAYLDGWW